MAKSIFVGVILCIFSNAFVIVKADIKTTAQSLDSFALDFLLECSKAIGKDNNLAIAPYTVWSLLSIITEGSAGNTEKQLVTALNIPNNRQTFRESFRDIIGQITKPADGVSLTVGNAVFIPDDQTLKPNFQTVARNFYGLDIRSENFKNLDQALYNINSYMSKATNGLVQNFLNKDDIADDQVILASTLYFKGEWTTPFNKSATMREAFYDDENNYKGDVDMMFQAGSFPYTVLTSLSSYVVELPYGRGDTMSMIVILPKKKMPLNEVLKQLTQFKIDKILETLALAAEDFVDEDVHVYLPKFKITSDLTLNQVLDSMGIKDLFNSERSNLLGMFHHYLYVSRIFHQAKIEVNEEGTVASASAGASFAYKSPPPVFKANRPFAYMIVEKSTRSIIFAGKVSNPKGLY